MAVLKLSSFDGIVLGTQGDVAIIFYGADARVDRTRWLFDSIEKHLDTHDGDLAVMIIIPAHAGTPDAATRAENSTRMKRIRRMRLLVTVALGDAFKTSIVRAIMRALAMLSGKTKEHLVVDTEARGIECILNVKSSRTPPRSELESLVSQVRGAAPLAA